MQCGGWKCNATTGVVGESALEVSLWPQRIRRYCRTGIDASVGDLSTSRQSDVVSTWYGWVKCAHGVVVSSRAGSSRPVDALVVWVGRAGLHASTLRSARSFSVRWLMAIAEKGCVRLQARTVHPLCTWLARQR